MPPADPTTPKGDIPMQTLTDIGLLKPEDITFYTAAAGFLEQCGHIFPHEEHESGTQRRAGERYKES